MACGHIHAVPGPSQDIRTLGSQKRKSLEDPEQAHLARVSLLRRSFGRERPSPFLWMACGHLPM
jgi:hypothetical protein